ncbi:MAG: extensin family protein [Bdellovibrionales bacterium]|nr:extensin family protein [Bdellovibrionales bacterium]
MQRFWALCFFIVLVGCGETSFEARSIDLDSLGENNDFSDVEIEDDFPAPEDEPPVEPIVIEEPPQRDPAEQPTPPSFKVDTFFLESQTFQLARGPALRWGGCEPGYESQGGYNSDTRCGRAFFHPAFSEQLNQAFFKCVQVSAREAGYAEPARVFINHLGSYNDRNARNSSRLSNHAFARALDISSFLIYDEQDNLTKVSTLLRNYTGAQAVFYDSFRSCWKDHLSENCTPGQTEYKGSIGHASSELGGNSLHNDHIHLSFPRCAG